MKNCDFKINTSLIIFLLILVFTPHQFLCTINSSTPLKKYVHRVWNPKNGIPLYISAITQTRDGYLWFGTATGLIRYDGVKFTSFNKQTSDKLKNIEVRALLEDRQGNLWIGYMGGGVVQMRKGEFTSFTTKDGLISNSVFSLYEDWEGKIWIGTQNGISCLMNRKLVSYSLSKSLLKEVATICQDSEGSLLIHLSSGVKESQIYQFQKGELRPYDFSRVFKKIGILSSTQIINYGFDNGLFWIYTPHHLFCSKDRKTIITVLPKVKVPFKNISCFALGQDNSCWIGLGSNDDGGIFRLKDNCWESFTKRDGLTSNLVISIFQDREKNLWIGTEDGGLNSLREGEFISYLKQDGLASENIHTIYEDQQEKLWIGGVDYLGFLKEGKFIQQKFQAENKNVRTICLDHLGNIWYGSGYGLTRLRNGQETSFTTKDGLPGNLVVVLHEDRAGNLWIGTYTNGLSCYRNGKFYNYTTKDGLCSNSIRVIKDDTDGNVWIGSRNNGGLNCFKDGKFISSYQVSDGLVNENVMSLHMDKAKSLWIGTVDGINRFENGKFTSYTTKNGLAQDNISCILEDDYRNMWMGSEQGIFRVSKQELNDFAEGKISRVTSISYGSENGLSDTTVSTGNQPNGWKTHDGRLWFATMKGIISVDPARLKTGNAPPVVIEKMLVDNQAVDLNHEIRLEAGKEKFEFHYTAPSFVIPQKVRFNYRLEGFDKSWQEAGTRRVAYYTNIYPGRYRFQVIACNQNGVWNEQGASISFYLPPFFYQTIWFYLLCLFAVAVISWVIYRSHVKRIKTEFSLVMKERSRIAREIHDTLAQGFVGIGMQIEAAIKKSIDSPVKSMEHLYLAQKLTQNCLDESYCSLWNLRVENYDYQDVVFILTENLKELTKGTLIEISVIVEGKNKVIEESIQRNILRIGREAIMNAIRHANPNKIEVKVQFDDYFISLRIKDDGCGFFIGEVVLSDKRYFGLKSMRERAESLGGELVIESKLGEGTEVFARLPLKR